MSVLTRLTVSREGVASLTICLLILAVALCATLFGGRAIQGTVANAFVLLVIVAGLGIFVGSTGILSFGHASFAAIAGYVSAILALPVALKHKLLPQLPLWIGQIELPVPVAVSMGVAAALLVGLVVGLPVLRLAGAAAVIATLGLLIMTNSILTGAVDFTRGAQAIYGIPGVGLWSTAVCACLAFLIARGFKESRSGLLARAARDDATAARAIGIPVERSRMTPWLLSVAIVGLGGALLAHRLTVISPKEFYFGQSFEWIVILIVGGVMSVGGNVLGAALIVLVIEVLRHVEQGVTIFGLTTPAVFGLTDAGLSVAILAVLIGRGAGLAGQRELDSLYPFSARPTVLSCPPVARQLWPAPMATTSAFEITSVSKSYGGVRALDDVSFTLRSGQIVGLIGPNGSGKSTLLGCMTGHLRLSSGELSLEGRRLTGDGADRMVGHGLARTFQNIRLFENLTVAENVEAALLATGQMRRRAQSHAVARQILADHDLAALADQPANILPYGTRRRLEIARAMACAPRFLLLDEPAAGMNEEESHRLGDLLRTITRDSGVGILLVEHDLPLVTRLCERIVVLEKGRKIAEAAPDNILRDPRVAEAYFGTQLPDLSLPN
jgi:branched-chain amino acid transport system permease protein